MHPFSHSAARSLLLALLVLLSVSVAGPARAAGSRDVLWSIVSTCLDPGAADYCASCRSPRVDTACAAERFCRETTEVWAETRDYVALRDRKMCGCPADFVHGLAIPRARVKGVEDPQRPDGIWSFAWEVAVRRIGDESATALVVNPVATRAQDQLHVHILRLKNGARDRFKPAQVARIQKLDEVWQAAGRLAAKEGLPDYGVLVARHPDGDFIVLVDRVSPEKSYAMERCR